MSNKGIINISGISDNRVAPVAAHIIKKKEGRCLVIVSSEVRASRLAKDLSFFLSSNIYEFPASDEMLMRFDAKNHDLLLKQQKILKSVLEDDSCVVIAPVMGVVKKMSPAAAFIDNVIKITPGEELETENLSRKLAAMGYERTTSVDSRGQFAVRGSVIDIFTPEGENPYRIELFDIEVDSVRMFNIFTQRSIKNLDAVEIYPAERIIRDEEI